LSLSLSSENDDSKVFCEVCYAGIDRSEGQTLCPKCRQFLKPPFTARGYSSFFPPWRNHFRFTLKIAIGLLAALTLGWFNIACCTTYAIAFGARQGTSHFETVAPLSLFQMLGLPFAIYILINLYKSSPCGRYQGAPAFLISAMFIVPYLLLIPLSFTQRQPAVGCMFPGPPLFLYLPIPVLIACLLFAAAARKNAPLIAGAFALPLLLIPLALCLSHHRTQYLLAHHPNPDLPGDAWAIFITATLTFLPGVYYLACIAALLHFNAALSRPDDARLQIPES
jgi:hypothetical protein